MNIKDLEFLKDLQKRMNEGDHVYQAEPRFWVLRQDVDIIVKENDLYTNKVYVETYTGTEFHTIKDLLDFMRNEDIEYRLIELIGGFGSIEEVFDNIKAINNEMDTYYFEIVYKDTVTEIIENTFFLTKEKAIEHIKQNAYHYNSSVRPYGMTGWRSPDFERLFDILTKADFDNVYLKEEE